MAGSATKRGVARAKPASFVMMLKLVDGAREKGTSEDRKKPSG
jgi:hypothetical protein